MKNRFLTLADYDVPIPLYCAHCDKRLPRSARAELQAPYIVIVCPKCGHMSPFKLEAA